MPKIMLAGDTTISGLIQPLQKQLNGDWQVIDLGYNRWLRQVVDDASPLNVDPPAFYIVILSPRFLEEEEYAEEQLTQFFNAMEQWKGTTRVLFSQFVVDPIYANRLLIVPHLQQIADRLNGKLKSFQLLHSWFQVIDMASFFIERGLDNVHDPRYEILARMYFSPGGIKHLADYVARYLKALMIPAKKVLVVDLDQTLWGGVLGEDGGVRLGGEGEGYAFMRFQKALLALKKSGILLVVCSKNNEKDALEVFEKHPDMILRLDDVAAYRINWQAKSENLPSLAQELNLGLDSFVFFDDSAFEREQIRKLLPEIDVLEVPRDAACYVKVLSDYRGFDKLALTTEDITRSKMYQEERQRQDLQKQSHSLEDFFQSLEMKAELSKASEATLERILQLIQKTNQFNLTTKRYSEQELHSMMHSDNFGIYLLRLADKLGESGITGVLIIEKKEKDWEIDTFLLSCRIIGRTVEYALMKWLGEKAWQAGANCLIGRYLPTSKNQVAANFFQNAGFHYDQQKNQWTMEVKDLKTIPKNYVHLQEKGF